MNYHQQGRWQNDLEPLLHSTSQIVCVPSECDDVIRRGARQQKAEGYHIERSLEGGTTQSISDLEQILGC